jgi:protein-S-isoprenylcysteine O-methyltransferase Ste14
MDFFDYFQAVFLLVFYFILIGRTVQLIRSGKNPIVLGAGKKGFRAVFEMSLLFGLSLWTFEVVANCLGLDFHFFRETQLFSIVSLKIVGVVIEIVGMAIFASAIFSFGSSWRVGIDKKSPGELVTGGVFSLSRNPIFLFLDIFFWGTFLIYPTLFFGISAVVVVFGNHFQILQEERFLEREYGDEYLDYKKRVRRYF